MKLGGALAPRWMTEQLFKRFGRPTRTTSRWDRAPENTFVLDAGPHHSLTAYEWNDQGTNGTALLVHGWSGNAGQLRKFVEPLINEGFHVLAVDLPAHGASPGSFATVPIFADTLAEVLHRFRPKVAVAHSMGATGLTLAMTRGVAPEKVVVLAPPVTLMPFLNAFIQMACIPRGLATRLISRVEAYTGGMDTLDLRLAARRLGGVAGLIVHDEQDRVVSVRSSEELAAAWEGSGFVRTSGLGHDKIRSDAEVVKQAIGFLALTLTLSPAGERGTGSASRR